MHRTTSIPNPFKSKQPQAARKKALIEIDENSPQEKQIGSAIKALDQIGRLTVGGAQPARCFG